MTDAERIELEVRRGELARQVLDNEIYKEAWASLHAGIHQAWESSPIRDKEGQHELRLMLKLLNDLHKRMDDVMQTGKMAKIERDNILNRIAGAIKGA